MGIVSCPDCGKQVSDSAPACPGCGRPMKEEVRTIQGTAKRYKLAKLFGWLLLLLGLALFLPTCTAGALDNSGSAPSLMVPKVFLGMGAALWVYGTFGKWWHHD